MEKEGEIAVLVGRGSDMKAPERLFRRVGLEAVGPGFQGKWRIGDDKVVLHQLPAGCRELGVSQHVALGDFCRFLCMQDHIHHRETACRDVHFLAEDRQLDRGRLGRFQKQGPRATGRVIDALLGVCGPLNATDRGDDARDLCRGVKLTFALAGLGCEIPHEVFVGVTEQVVAVRAVAREVQFLTAEDVDQVGQRPDHLLTTPEFLGIIEEGTIDHAAEIILLGNARDGLVHLLANFFVAAQGAQI